jgi:hypothetical protein
VIDFYQAASEPTSIKGHDAYHQLNEEAGRDRTGWLRRQLKLYTGPVPGENIGAGPGLNSEGSG